MGREEPAMSMDASTGKIVWAKHCEIQQVNLKQLTSDQQLKDGEKVPLSVKELGSCEIYPQTLSHQIIHQMEDLLLFVVMENI